MVAVMLVLLIGLIVLGLTGSFSSIDVMQSVVVLVLAGIGMYVGVRRLNSARKGEPAEDELSRSMLQQSAALSFYISLYLWLVIIYLDGKLSLDSEQLMGMGVVGMAVVFVLCWVVLKVRGLKND